MPLPEILRAEQAAPCFALGLSATLFDVMSWSIKSGSSAGDGTVWRRRGHWRFKWRDMGLEVTHSTR